MRRKRNVLVADEFIPIWFRFTPDWYSKLKALADQSGVTMDAVIREGVRLYAKTAQAKGTTDGTTDLPDNVVSTSATELAKRRWRKLSPEQRREQARIAAQKRWATKKGTKKGEAG